MKNKIMFFLSILFIMTSVVSQTYAKDIEIVIPEKTVTIFAGQKNELEILMKNDRDVRDTLYFSAWPTRWLSLDKYWVSLGPGETTNVSIVIEPPRDAEEGTYILTFTAKSVDYNISASKDIYFFVKRTISAYVSEIKINEQIVKPRKTLLIQPIVTNIDKKISIEVLVTTKILKDKLIVQKFEDAESIPPESAKTFSHSFDIKTTHVPGEYFIDVTLRDKLYKVLDEKAINFKVEEVRQISKEKETKSGLFYSDVIIRFTNNGNVPETSFYVEESLPIIAKNFFYPETEPITEEEKDNRIVYTWIVQGLAQNETITIKYQLRFVNVVIISCILIVAIVWVLWLFYKPKLMKRYMGLLTEGKEITISLHFKNRGRQVLNNVVVKDLVPALAAVTENFDTFQPKIKRKPTGTELTWNIKQLKPKEERVLTYKIKPVVEIIGKLRLPKAYLTYETKKGKTSRVLSKTVMITGKVK